MKMKALVIVVLLVGLLAGVAFAQTPQPREAKKTDLTPVPKDISRVGVRVAPGPDVLYSNIDLQNIYENSYIPPDGTWGQMLDQGTLKKAGGTVNGFAFVAQNHDSVAHNAHLYLEIYQGTNFGTPGTLYKTFDLGVVAFPPQSAYTLSYTLDSQTEFALGRGTFGYSVYADMADSDMPCEWVSAYTPSAGSGDWFWVDNDPQVTGFDGLIWFNGYPANPHASFSLELYGVRDEVPVPSMSTYGIGALMLVLLGSAVVLIARKKATVTA